MQCHIRNVVFFASVYFIHSSLITELSEVLTPYAVGFHFAPLLINPKSESHVNEPYMMSQHLVLIF
jgi:hypothetical protein